MQPQTIDFQQIRLDHDLTTLVTQYLGQPKAKKWPCPFHKEDTASFCITPDKRHFKCFGCGVTGDVTDFVAMIDKITLTEASKKLGGYLLDLGLSKEEIKAKQAEIRREYQRRQAELEAQERQKRLEAITKISQMSSRVEEYHRQVELARNYWHSQGLPDWVIARRRLGYAPECPTYPNSPSYVIPYLQLWPDHPNPKLVSIRHRLASPNGSGKYRPEFAGLPTRLFNLDALKPNEEVPFQNLEPGQVLLVEGEVKAMFLSDVAGLPSVGVPGANAWNDEWIPFFQGSSLVYVVFDQGVEQQSMAVTRAFNENGVKAVHVTLPCKKPDDFFVRHGGSISDFLNILKQGRKVV